MRLTTAFLVCSTLVGCFATTSSGLVLSSERTRRARTELLLGKSHAKRSFIAKRCVSLDLSRLSMELDAEMIHAAGLSCLHFCAVKLL